MSRIPGLTLAVALSVSVGAAFADDRRQVDLPGPMAEHMLANMRDHLAAIQEIQAALASGEWSTAADVAENRLGASSMGAHGASHMAPHMPPEMREIGSGMHAAASRFARKALESAVDNDLAGALASLAEVTSSCVACHAGFRIR